MSFGFSAGDFICALELVGNVRTALRSSGGSSAEYRALISQLYTLESALLQVKQLELDEEQHAQAIALRQAAAQCQKAIDTFWEKIKKYQPSLRARGSGDNLCSKATDVWRKVEWALCRKEDLVKFKADLVAHTESIEVLLLAVQMGAAQITNKRNFLSQKTLAGRIQELYVSCMGKLSVILGSVTIGIEQGRRLLEMVEGIVKTNVQVFQIVLELQNFIKTIPSNVERQQPVYFVDALGRRQAFHLEFILSAEAFIAVLKSNFRNVGSGTLKIDRGEFAIQDSTTKRDIDLRGPWENCFRPGQMVDMSMIFFTKKNEAVLLASCPTCAEHAPDHFKLDMDVECGNCGLVYRRSVFSFSAWLSSQPCFNESDNDVTTRGSHVGAKKPHPASLKRKKPHDDDEEDLALFRRVRIRPSLIREKSVRLEAAIAPMSVLDQSYTMPKKKALSKSGENTITDASDGAERRRIADALDSITTSIRKHARDDASILSFSRSECEAAWVFFRQQLVDVGICIPLLNKHGDFIECYIRNISQIEALEVRQHKVVAGEYSTNIRGIVKLDSGWRGLREGIIG